MSNFVDDFCVLMCYTDTIKICKQKPSEHNRSEGFFVGTLYTKRSPTLWGNCLRRNVLPLSGYRAIMCLQGRRRFYGGKILLPHADMPV